MGSADLCLHVLHTNDFHDGLDDVGEARLRAAVNACAGAPYLLLDAGDAIRAGNVGVNPFGEPILDRMSALGYHAMTMGNREFHVWQAALETKIRRARFPVLCANVRSRGDRALPVQPNVTISLGGLIVAVFGLTVPMVTERMKVAALSSFVFDDPVATAKRQVAELRYGADVLIALTHIGLTQDQRLAREVTGIDLIVGGHSHNALEAPCVVNGTPIVQAGSHAHYYGAAEVHVTRDGVQVTDHLHLLQEKRRKQVKGTP
jgi:2',3'-cyclic-nucleotide 2'-phosphodiesterase (5'-nucleotidase family)